MKKDYLLIIGAILLSFLFFGLAHSGIKSSDSQEYQALASGLINNGTFSFNNELTNFREPGYPVFLALVNYLFNNNTATIRCLQLIIFISAVLFFYGAVRDYFNSDRAALTTSFLIGSFPSFAFYHSLVLSESVYVSLLVVFLGLLIRGNWWWLIGLVIGLMILIKVATIILVVPIIIFIWWRNGWRSVLVTLTLVLALVLPWCLRNYLVLNDFSITSGRQQESLLAATYFLDRIEIKDYLDSWPVYLSYKLGLIEKADFDFFIGNFIPEGRKVFWSKFDDFKRQSSFFGGNISSVRIFYLMIRMPLIAVDALVPEFYIIDKNLLFQKELPYLIFKIGYLIFYLLIYWTLFKLIIVFIFKRRVFDLEISLLAGTVLMILGYSFFIGLPRFNVPLFVIYIFLNGWYFDRFVFGKDADADAFQRA